MKDLKRLGKEITPKSIVHKAISNQNFYDLKQHFFGKRSKLTFGQKAADSLTQWAGSWTFILSVGVFIFAWISLNLTAYVRHWDPWPFIILNLCLSCLAAMQAPIILMSQNRASERDRLRADYDYAVNRKAEKEIRDIQKNLEIIKKHLKIKE